MPYRDYQQPVATPEQERQDWFLPASMLVCLAIWLVVGLVAGMVRWSGVDVLTSDRLIPEHFFGYWGLAGLGLIVVLGLDIRAERQRVHRSRTGPAAASGREFP